MIEYSASKHMRDITYDFHYREWLTNWSLPSHSLLTHNWENKSQFTEKIIRTRAIVAKVIRWLCYCKHTTIVFPRTWMSRVIRHNTSWRFVTQSSVKMEGKNTPVIFPSSLGAIQMSGKHLIFLLYKKLSVATFCLAPWFLAANNTTVFWPLPEQNLIKTFCFALDQHC